MARISTYSSDNTVNKSDKLLGSNADGTTRNFSIEDITTYLRDIGVSGKFTLKFFVGNSTQQSGTFMIPGNNSQNVAFSTLTTIRVSKYPFSSTDSVLERINQFKNETVIIANVEDINKFGVYNISSISQVGSTDFYDISLTTAYGIPSFVGNGNLEDELKYSIDVYKSDRRYTHHQNNSASTWTIAHNLGKFPSVSLKFSSSDSVYTNVGAFAGVTFTDENNLTINLAAAESGYAYLN